MAWLELKPSGTYHIAFRFGNEKFKKSLKTRNEAEAESRRHRLEENIRLVESGRLTLPEGSDIALFLLSDGKIDATPTPPKSIRLGKLFEEYQEALPENSMEPGSIRVAEIHMRHIVRVLGARKAVRRVSAADLQTYVTTRSREPGKHGNLSPGTIKKELSTFSSLWTWASTRGYVASAFPKAGLMYPKYEEKPPFQTWRQIEHQINFGNLSEAEITLLWDCLYLDRDQIAELLTFVQNWSNYSFLYPMVVVAAYTGARRSELCRSRRVDFDFEESTILIRERKRARGKRTTRLVPMTPLVSEVMRRWLSPASASPFTFPEEHRCKRERKQQIEEGCVAPDEASHHFYQCLHQSKWKNLKGWHVFRHSFISNCAASGVDQRMIDTWVGHQTDEMRRRYTHLFPDAQREAIAAVFG